MELERKDRNGRLRPGDGNGCVPQAGEVGTRVSGMGGVRLWPRI